MRAWGIRRRVSIAAPAEAVWAYVGVPELLSRWWCPPPTVRLAFEPRPGGRFEERYDDGRLAYRVEGTVLAYEPPRRLAVRRFTPGSPAPADVVEITLHEEGGRTRVVVRHAFEGLPPDRRRDMVDCFARPWSLSLRALWRLVMASHRDAAVQGPVEKGM
ncbi:MAG: SRPBCC domain-containing protein [Firmicutes bacterium]|nr:SRPBCC domain-containing protein [Bacillota bacterium]